MRRLLTVAATCAALCSGCGEEQLPPKASFNVRESIEQLAVTHAKVGATLQLLDSSGMLVQSGIADELGSLLFRKVKPGSGYVIRRADSETEDRTGALTVYSIESSRKDPSFYKNQQLQPGFGYITTRDGTTLSVYITLPGPIEKGPYPTVVNYSGYDPSKPGKPYDQFSGLCSGFPALCDPPNDPSAMLAAMNGYATVGVNVRGSGCSGGAYDYFDTLQKLDSYDVVETVASQPWVLHHKVGLTGLSYPGISQLFVASQRPPSLAAITPLSVVGNMFMTLAPGGVLNTGFAVNWITRVLDKAGPYKQGWEQAMVDAGNVTCGENQLLHGQKANLVDIIKSNAYYPPEIADPINPETQIGNINVPVFLAGAWQDEQTGAYFMTLLNRFTGSPLVRFHMYNGVHPDGFSPQILVEWKTFLDLYVARKVPQVDQKLRAVAPLLFKDFFGAKLEIPPDRHADKPTWEAARAAYEAEPMVRVLFESGGLPSNLGAPESRYQATFAAWPPKSQPVRYYFRKDGSMSATAPTETGAASQFQFDAQAGQRGNLASGGDIWAVLPKWDWKPLQAGKSVAWQTEPLSEDTVMVGTASVDLFVQSTASDADLQVVLSEIRPDGQEMFVQTGILRASMRALAKTATPLWPEHTYLEPDGAPLPTDKWSEVRIGIPGFGHAFRKGSRLRLSVGTPGGNHAEWRFQLAAIPANSTHKIGHSVAQPSSILLPVVSGVTVPATPPACPSLRGQPCRAYQALVNSPVP